MEIIAKTQHTDDPLYHYGNDFEFYSYIYFLKEFSSDRIYSNIDFSDFIADVTKYKSYTSDTLNEIEIDIDIFK